MRHIVADILSLKLDATASGLPALQLKLVIGLAWLAVSASAGVPLSCIDLVPWKLIAHTIRSRPGLRAFSCI